MTDLAQQWVDFLGMHAGVWVFCCYAAAFFCETEARR